jgi:hypothetical protein
VRYVGDAVCRGEGPSAAGHESQRHRGTGGLDTWNFSGIEDNARKAADSRNVTIVHLEADRVSPLYSRHSTELCRWR